MGYNAWSNGKTLTVDGGITPEPMYWAGVKDKNTNIVEGYRDKCGTLSIQFEPDNIKNWFTMEVVYPGDTRYTQYGGSCGTTIYPIVQTVVQANAPKSQTKFKIYLKGSDGTLSDNWLDVTFNPLSSGSTSTYIDRYLKISFTDFIRNTVSDTDNRSMVYLVTTLSPGTVLTASHDITKLTLSYQDLHGYGYIFRGDDIAEKNHGNVLLYLTWVDDKLQGRGGNTTEGSKAIIIPNILTVNNSSYTTIGLNDYSVIKDKYIYVWNLVVEKDWNNITQIVKYNGYVGSTVPIANISSDIDNPTNGTLYI